MNVQGHFSERAAAHVMRQLLQFMQYMHERNVVHRWVVQSERPLALSACTQHKQVSFVLEA